MSFTQLSVDTMRRWREAPSRMVLDLFGVEPDKWQRRALDEYRTSPRMAMQACKGPGKTAVLAWIAWNFLLTRPHPMIGATSVTGDNLKANLQTELSRWYGKSELLQALFEVTSKEIRSREHKDTWKLQFRTWPRAATAEIIANALSGLHAAFVMWLLDETGDYPDAVLPTCEGIFQGEPAEAHVIQAGNPLKRAGPLYRAAIIARQLWNVIEITADPDNPERTTRVSIAIAREQINQYGRDNPWVLVNIFGKFPPSSINALIGDEEVMAAMKRYYRAHEIGNAAKVLGIDVARYGDDASVIYPRQGIQLFPALVYRNVNGIEGAGAVARKADEWGADAIFLDMTGGFGASWFDQLVALQRAPIGVQFAGSPHDKNRYANKRTEMYFDAVEWIKRGGALPEQSPELLADLVNTTYTFQGDRLILEPKELIKVKLGRSPDWGDGFAVTHAEPVAPRERQLGDYAGRVRTLAEHNPYAHVYDVPRSPYE